MVWCKDWSPYIELNGVASLELPVLQLFLLQLLQSPAEVRGRDVRVPTYQLLQYGIMDERMLLLVHVGGGRQGRGEGEWKRKGGGKEKRGEKGRSKREGARSKEYTSDGLSTTCVYKRTLPLPKSLRLEGEVDTETKYCVVREFVSHNAPTACFRWN